MEEKIPRCFYIYFFRPFRKTFIRYALWSVAVAVALLIRWIQYFEQPNEFPEVDAFIEDCVHRYDLKLERQSGGFKAGLQELLDKTEVKAIYIGTRLGDPGAGSLAPVSLSDEGWPEFFRVHPVLDWTYSDVWEYLSDKPYCKLYDQGYTSLGSTKDTVQNPVLCKEDGTFRPAHELGSGGLERHGRGAKSAVGETPPDTSARCHIVVQTAVALGETDASAKRIIRQLPETHWQLDAVTTAVELSGVRTGIRAASNSADIVICVLEGKLEASLVSQLANVLYGRHVPRNVLRTIRSGEPSTESRAFLTAQGDTEAILVQNVLFISGEAPKPVAIFKQLDPSTLSERWVRISRRLLGGFAIGAALLALIHSIKYPGDLSAYIAAATS